MSRPPRRGRKPWKQPMSPERLGVLTQAAHEGWPLPAIAARLGLTRQRAEQLLNESHLHDRWRAERRALAAARITPGAERYLQSERGRELLEVRDHLQAAGYAVTLRMQAAPPQLWCGRRRVRLLRPRALHRPDPSSTTTYYHSSVRCRGAIYAVFTADGRRLVFFPPYRCGATLYIPAGPRLWRGVPRRTLPALEWRAEAGGKRRAA